MNAERNNARDQHGGVPWGAIAAGAKSEEPKQPQMNYAQANELKAVFTDCGKTHSGMQEVSGHDFTGVLIDSSRLRAPSPIASMFRFAPLDKIVEKWLPVLCIRLQ